MRQVVLGRLPVESMRAFGDNWHKFLKFVLQVIDAASGIASLAAAVQVSVVLQWNIARQFMQVSAEKFVSNSVNLSYLTGKIIAFDYVYLYWSHCVKFKDKNGTFVMVVD